MCHEISARPWWIPRAPRGGGASAGVDVDAGGGFRKQWWNPPPRSIHDLFNPRGGFHCPPPCFYFYFVYKIPPPVVDSMTTVMVPVPVVPVPVVPVVVPVPVPEVVPVPVMMPVPWWCQWWCRCQWCAVVDYTTTHGIHHRAPPAVVLYK